MTKAELNEYLEFAKSLAKEAGDIMLRYFRADDIGVELKDDKTLVTIADTKINNMVIDAVKAKFPDHSVHGEEGSFAVEHSELTWVCDPIDGTLPFAKGLPISTFSLGLVGADGDAYIGVAYDPYQDRMYEAAKGHGSLLNGRKIMVSKKTELEGAFLDNELWRNEKEGVSFTDPRGAFADLDVIVTSQCSAVITGCLVAEGLYDAMIFGQSKPEDIAALKVIVEEAGGKVTSLAGNVQRYDQKIYGAIVSNGLIHDDIIKVIEKINYQSKYVEHS